MKGDSLKTQLKDYVDQIEDKIDLRYESVFDSLQTYRSECKSKLFNFHEDFEKLILFLLKQCNLNVNVHLGI